MHIPQQPAVEANAANINTCYAFGMKARSQAAALQPLVPQQGSTHAQRFTDAVRVLCGGAVPPSEFVADWLAGVEVDGLHQLQHWVLSQPGHVAWAQGIGILDAAAVLAAHPEEGCDHEILEERPASSGDDDRPAYGELVSAMRDMEAAFAEARVTAAPWGGLRSRFRALLRRIPAA